MRFTETSLAGAFIIEPQPIADERGFFARTWSVQDMEATGLDPALAQCNIAWNKSRGTLRGMHFQREPFGEVKIVRCTRGAILDVIVNLRPHSLTRCQWTSVELSANTRRMLYIPKGFAHGYLTLCDDVETYYHVSAPYSPQHASGVRWDDPAFRITWPFPPSVISERDLHWPDFEG